MNAKKQTNKLELDSNCMWESILYPLKSRQVIFHFTFFQWKKLLTQLCYQRLIKTSAFLQLSHLYFTSPTAVNCFQ